MDVESQLKQLSSTKEFEAIAHYSKSFDLFRVMGVSSKELVHSNIIAAFLNEREAHGLGPIFRDAYVLSLDECPCTGTPLPLSVMQSAIGARAKVARELAHIDILIEFPAQRLVVAIENKIWAQDQNEQIARYQRVLCELYPHYPNRALVYLTPTGRPSPTVDPTSTPVYYQSYGQLAALFRRCRVQANDAAGQFIDQFVSHTEKTMSGTTELRELCWEIFSQSEDAYEQLIKNYDYCLQRKLDQQFGELRDLVHSHSIFREWAGEIETKASKNKAKRQYELDVRLLHWPTGVWVKIFKHTWFGVFPYFLQDDLAALSRHLPLFTASACPIPDWPGHYAASTRYVVKHDRQIHDEGDKATDEHRNVALTKVRDCIVEINAALAGN